MTAAPAAAPVHQRHPASPDHERAVEALRTSYAAIPEGTLIRLEKAKRNVSRFRAPLPRPGLDVSAFDRVLHLDTQARTVSVGGMMTYEDLLDVTLMYGLKPKVVPSFRTVTVGGAVAGLGIEASSFRAGMPQESVLEMEILTGGGEVVTARRDNEHAALFRAFPHSFGSLGYALRLTIELEPVKPYVWLRRVRFGSATDCSAAVASITESRQYSGQQVDFMDGWALSPEELYLTLGTFVDEAPAVSDYTGSQIYHRSISRRSSDHMRVQDFLYRFDTDMFYSAKDLGLANPVVRALWPRAKRRSDVYFGIVAADARKGISERLGRWTGRRMDMVFQDPNVPLARLGEFLQFVEGKLGIMPAWFCPLKPAEQWSLYPVEPGSLNVTVGFWGQVPLRNEHEAGHFNRLVEEKVTELGGHKPVMSSGHYPEDEFWSIYGGSEFWRVRETYDPRGRLVNLYDKCVRAL
ncbi:FAD-binding oxidoreductase [Streptomyces sp. N2-109]|uniref:Delta(24)-sterol reductase n=1 Tax=Streptomyces gossypii TaxID=2883101 RepID=A0ABT2JNY6_9ACTN|nr:FAD-binding oxidoreductase [Streptomyces gossypii]MCT2589581.1 FAD-binding oxidoreductase [Streptomyces gossypii]